jgi:hypothetical protein
LIRKFSISSLDVALKRLPQRVILLSFLSLFYPFKMFCKNTSFQLNNFLKNVKKICLFWGADFNHLFHLNKKIIFFLKLSR